MLEANHAWTIKPLRDLLGSRILIKLGSKGTGPADDSDRPDWERKTLRINVRSHLRHALPIVCGLTALAPLTSQDAFAQTIPSYGTNAHCQRVAGFGGTFSQSVYGSCLNMEQSAALALQARWSSIPASVRERCDRIASFGGSASYSILQNCVDVELAAPAPSGPPAAGGTMRFYLVTSGGGGTPYNTLSECLEARAKAAQTAICINR